MTETSNQNDGILPLQALSAMADAGVILSGDNDFADGQLQPASLDLRLGAEAWRVQASFLPGAESTVAQKLKKFAMHKIDLSEGAVLGVGSIDKAFGFLFGFFKGYIVSVCLFSIFNWFYPYQNWGISAEKAFSFNLMIKGSEILIEEFPSGEDIINTKEKIEKI